MFGPRWERCTLTTRLRLSAAGGADIDEQGYGIVREARMYQLIRQSDKIADRESVIEFLSSGVSVYDFTFG